MDRDILVYESVPGEGRSYLQLQNYFQEIWDLSCCKPFKTGEEKENIPVRQLLYKTIKETQKRWTLRYRSTGSVHLFVYDYSTSYFHSIIPPKSLIF